MYQSIFNINQQKEHENPLLIKISQTHKVLNETIDSIADVQEQFNLYELALGKRKANIKEGQDDYLVDLLIQLGGYGIKLPSLEVKLAAMKYSEEAYNIACKHNIDKSSATVLFAILNNMKDLAKEFGDMGKVKLISNQIEHLEFKLGIGEEKKNDDDAREYIPILKQGSSTETILNIKKQIQATVLDQVQEAAAIGKWFNYGIVANYGVAGYLNEAWLGGKLGAFNSEENLNAALKLCFEAINIGIMNSENHNPLCAAIFAKEYPDLINEILENNPEYFVDGAILRVSLIDADDSSYRLTGKALKENDSGYNRYFEEEMKVIIAERTQDAILSPIKEIITKQEWSGLIGAKLTAMLSDEFISQTVGKNLPQIPDMFNIVRILALKEITQQLKDSKSVIFSPVQLFTKLYPELVKRVQENHPDFVDDETVTRCIELEFDRQEAEAVAIMEAEEAARIEAALAAELKQKEAEEAAEKDEGANEPELLMQEVQVMGDAEDQAV